jgi:hypothetical protein
MLSKARAAAAVFAANLLLFLAVTTLSAFQAAHHHWIFPVFAVLLAAQWALTFTVKSAPLRANVASMLVFLLVIGISRHATILACFERCSFKLAAAALIAGFVFLGQARAADEGFWGPLRAHVAAAGSLLWALALVLRGLDVTHWLSDILFAIIALGAVVCVALPLAAAPRIASRGLLGRFRDEWRRRSRFPLVAAILPGPFSGLALSDQLNFWSSASPL